MADTPAKPKTEDDYESTPEDRSRARILGIIYIVLAILLAWMLFKIWPPTPWPTDKFIDDNPQLAESLKACACAMPSPSPTPNSSPTTSQTPAPTPTPTATPTATPATPGAGTQPTPTNAGRTGSPMPTPSASPSPSPSPSPTRIPSDALVMIPIDFFWGLWRYCTSFDERLILLVIVAGMLGSFVHGATSLADFIGNNKFNKAWTWFYVLRPAIGMALALVFYFVIRGGFLTTSGGAKDINPYGIAALAGLVGMFSKQATDKLSEVFGTLFRAAAGEGDDKRSGSLTSDGGATKLTVTSVSPNPAKTTDPEITVSGTNFVTGAQVFVDNTGLVTTFVSATTLTASLAGVSAGAFKLKVVNPDATESATVDFTVQ